MQGTDGAHGSRPEPGGPQSRTLGGTLRELRIGAPVFAVAIAVCLAAAVLATVLQPELNGARGSLVVSPERFLNPDVSDALPALTNTVTELGTSAAVLELTATAYVRAAPDPRAARARAEQATTEWLRKHLRFRRVGLSSVIEVDGKATTQTEAVQLTSAAVTSLARFVRDRRVRELPAQGQSQPPESIELVVLSLAEPRGRVSPTPLRNLLVGLLAGYLLGSVLALLYGRYRKPRTRAATAADLPLPSLGAVGDRRPGPGVAEARRLIEAVEASDTGVAVLVTGTALTKRIGEVAERLVRSLNEEGRRALLVDGDLGGREISRRLGVGDSLGLANLLAGEPAALETGRAVVDAPKRVADDEPELPVLPAGARSGASAGTVNGHRLWSALDSLGSEFSFFVISAPNVARLPEVFALLSAADCWLLVVDGAISQQQFSHVRTIIHEAPARPLGVLSS